jgi:hypothetical protein
MDEFRSESPETYSTEQMAEIIATGLTNPQEL